jgi:hypothetical protein
MVDGTKNGGGGIADEYGMNSCSSKKAKKNARL